MRLWSHTKLHLCFTLLVQSSNAQTLNSAGYCISSALYLVQFINKLTAVSTARST